MLDEVIIKRDLLVRKQGDSIKYKLKDFTNLNDRKLEDALRNIPGLEIDGNGTIKYQGMSLSNFYIEGDDILSKNYKIATQNFNTEVIDEIQILENNQPIKLLQGRVIPKNAALNLTLKEEYKNIWIHNLDVGLGVPNLYKMNYFNTLISKKIKVINVLKFNNVGQDLSTMFANTDFSDVFNKFDLNFRENILSVSNTSLPPLSKNRFENRVFAASTNTSYKLNTNVDFKTNTIFYNDYNPYKVNSATTFNNVDTAIGYIENNSFSKKGNYFIQNSILRKNTNTIYWTNDFKAEFYKEKSYSELKNSNSTQDLNNHLIQFINKFNAIKTIVNTLFNFNSYLYVGSLKDELIIRKGIFPNLLNDNKDYFSTNQLINNRIFFFKNLANFSYTKNLWKFQSELANIFSNRDINTDLSLTQNSGDVTILPEYLNQNNTIFNKTSVLARIILKKEQLKWESSFVPTYYTFISLTNKNVFSKVFQTEVEQKFGRENLFNIEYSFNNVPTNVLDNYENYYLQNFRSFYRNQLDYFQTNSHKIASRLVLQRTSKLLFINLDLEKTFNQANFIGSNSFSSASNRFEYILFENYNEKTKDVLGISKYFFTLKSNFKINVKYNLVVQNQLNNDVLIPFENEIQEIRFNFNPKFFKTIGFTSEYSFQKNTNKNKITGFKNQVIFHYSKNNFDVNFTENCSLRLSNEFIQFRNLSKNANHYLDAFLSYKNPKSKFSYELKWSNILNRDRYIIQNNTEFISSEIAFFIRPQNLLLTMYYKF
ncbi:hypothetical protein [Flavobacterium limicola]|uniref:hypothetical protein n=1 Tax=Flavobacterium limicola TaxID=180441 RepID=UPI000EAE1390|nr:hypothetical protein [Flavobacterium limicola]